MFLCKAAITEVLLSGQTTTIITLATYVNNRLIPHACSKKIVLGTIKHGPSVTVFI